MFSVEEFSQMGYLEHNKITVIMDKFFCIRCVHSNFLQCKITNRVQYSPLFIPGKTCTWIRVSFSFVVNTAAQHRTFGV